MERPCGKQLSLHTDSQHQLPDMGMTEPSDESSPWLRVFHFKPHTLWSRNTPSPLCPSKSPTHRICEHDTRLFMPEKLEESNSVWVYIDGVRNGRSYCCEQLRVFFSHSQTPWSGWSNTPFPWVLRLRQG